MSGELTPMSVAVEDVRASADDMGQAAWRMGLSPDEPLGIWVSCMRRTVVGLARLMERQVEATDAVLVGRRAVLDGEIAKGRSAGDAAALAMAEAQANLTRARVEAEKLTLKTIEELTPKILEEIRDAVVIREKRYNRRAEWRRHGLTALAVICLALGGYSWRAWQDHVATSALSRCAEQQFEAADGKTYCALSALLPQQRSEAEPPAQQRGG